MSDKYREFQRAVEEFESQLSAPITVRCNPRQWWEYSCAVLLQDKKPMPEDLASRLDCPAGAYYGNGARAFLSRIRGHITNHPNSRWATVQRPQFASDLVGRMPGRQRISN